MKRLNSPHDDTFSNKTSDFCSSNEIFGLKMCSLKTLKLHILIETKRTIEILEQGALSLLSLINHHIKNLIELKTRSINSKIKQNKLPKLSPKKMIINKFNLSDTNKALKEKISESHSNLIQFRDKEFNKNKFLKYHNGEFRCAVVSKDGKLLATGGYDTTIRLWDLENKEQVACLIYHRNNITCLDISKNDYFIASGSFDKTVALWDFNKRQVIRVYSGHSDAICAVSISNDSSFMVSCSENNEIIVWDVKSGKSLNKVVFNYFIWSAFVTSKQFLYIGVGSILEIRNIIDFQLSTKVKHYDEISIFTLSQNEELLIASSYYSISILDNSSMLLKFKLQSPKSSFELISITPDNSHLITSLSDNSIILWSMHSQTILHEFQIHSDLIRSIVSLNNLIISVSIDKKIGLSKISKKSFKCYLQLKTFNYDTLSIREQKAFYGDNKSVVVLNY